MTVLAGSHAAADSLATSLADRLEATIARHLPAGTPVAVVDFPNNSNIGDAAIWLGTTRLLRQRGQPIVHVCEEATYSRRAMQQRLGTDGVILIQGGGSLGDVWPERQRFREEVISAFPGNRIIQLSQTIHFRERAALDQARAVFAAHPHLTLLCRDTESHALAQREFDCATDLCPDMAFALRRLVRPDPPEADLFWLARTDSEAVRHARPGADVMTGDWLGEARGEPGWTVETAVARRVTGQFLGRFQRRPRVMHAAGRPLRALYDRVAAQRVALGTRVLGRGRVVVTDRLHGHILCVLLGIRHVVLDSGYGKLRRHHRTWTSADPDIHCVDSVEAALAGARDLLAKPESSGQATR